MRILVVNDDGIKAPGIKRLVQMAAGLGEVCDGVQCVGNPGRLRESGTWMSDDRKTGYRIFRDQCRL